MRDEVVAMEVSDVDLGVIDVRGVSVGGGSGCKVWVFPFEWTANMVRSM